jgi:hypothetical protein
MEDAATLLTCYQHTDKQSMLQVMAAPNKLMSLGARKIHPPTWLQVRK